MQKDNQRLLTLGELQAVGQFFWDSVFATSIRGRISIEMAMSQVSLNHLVDMELIPKPTLPSLAHPNLNNKRKLDGQGGASHQPGLTKSARKKQN